MPVTLRQAILPLDDPEEALRPVGGRPLVAWAMRELQRFGVEEFLLPGLEEAALEALAGALPKPARLKAPPDRIEALDGPGPFLLAPGASLVDADLALLIREGPGAAGVGYVVLDRRRIGLFPGTMTWTAMAPALGASGQLRRLSLAGRRLPGDEAGVARLRRRALFLDRDGVLNEDHGYVHRRDHFHWIKGALALIRRATAAGWHVFIVTNQSGVARGLYAEADVAALHDWVGEEVIKAGGTIDDIRICPFHPEGTVEAYRRASDWRKPGPGMLTDLIRRWELDPARALMIGDQPTDLDAARAAGVAGHRFEGGDLEAFGAPLLDHLSG